MRKGEGVTKITISDEILSAVDRADGQVNVGVSPRAQTSNNSSAIPALIMAILSVLDEEQRKAAAVAYSVYRKQLRGKGFDVADQMIEEMLRSEGKNDGNA